MNDLTQQPLIPFIGLSEEETTAALAAVEELRSRKREEAASRAAWEPVMTELEATLREEGSTEMALRFIERSKLCGWDEDEDCLLSGLVMGLVHVLDLDVMRDRRTGEVVGRRRR